LCHTSYLLNDEDGESYISSNTVLQYFTVIDRHISQHMIR
jgi:hypothetical protein